jgi:hypothetical protein
MNGPDGGTQRPPSENDSYAPDDSPRAAKRLLRPRRSYAVPVIILIVLGAVALLVAIGISRLGPIEKLRPSLQDEAPSPPKRLDRFSERSVEPIESFKSMVLDTAQSYLTAGSLSVATIPPAKGEKAPKAQ